MSANNWTVCPRCKREAEQRMDALRTQVATSYGKMGAEEWLRLRDESLKKLVIAEDFREDYEIYGASEGGIEVSYRGGCQKCGLSCKFTYSKVFFDEGKEVDRSSG